MVDITKDKLEENDIEAIVDKNGELWINENHLEQEMGHSNLRVGTSKYHPMYKKSRFETVDEPIVIWQNN